jgi:formamidopyrimidine-DNA glycosylase
MPGQDIPAPTGELTEEGVMALMQAVERQQASAAAMSALTAMTSTTTTIAPTAAVNKQTTISAANIGIHGRDKYRCKECGGSAYVTFPSYLN